MILQHQINKILKIIPKANRFRQANFTRTKKFLKQMAFPTQKFFVWQDINAATGSTSDLFMQIAFDFPTGGVKNERIYMKRLYSDKFASTKKRLQCKLKNHTPEILEPRIEAISEDGEMLHEELTNYEVFYGLKKCSTVNVAGVEFNVVRDSIWLDKIELALDPLVNCPIIPSIDWKREGENVQYHWFVSETNKPLEIKFADAGKCRMQVDGWEYVGTGLVHCPSESHIGKYLAVVVDLGENGISHWTICGTKVARPNDPDGEEFIFQQRQALHCQEKLTGNRIRVLSYNVLAQLYLNDWLKKREQADQYFPYCPKQFQIDRYRYPLILHELPGYNADLLFLQEVDFRFQKRFLLPFLKLNGFTPVFNCKENQVNEGLLMAFRSERFELVEGGNYSVKLSNLLEHPFNGDILHFLEAHQQTYQVLSSRPSILQLVHLRPIQGHLDLLVANTHLHFDPAHEDVKVLQALLCLRHISNLLANKFSGRSPQVLFAGDFNSQPGMSAVRMLQGEPVRLPAGEQAEQRQLSFFQRLKAYLQRNFLGNPNEQSRLVLRDEPIRFQCASGFPDYTNYTMAEGKGFVGCLDYIWAYPPLRVEKIVPMPDHQLVTKFGAIPSKICPSDHLPLICEVSLPSSPPPNPIT